MKLYLAVTADQYELPMFVTDKPQKMADRFGITKDYLFQSIARPNKNRKKCGARFIRIEVED